MAIVHPKNGKTMWIKDDMTIRDLQRAFNEKFPFLRIEFYTEPHEPHQGSPATKQIPPDKKIGEVRLIHSEGDFRIDPKMKVAELEQLFQEKYGLYVQVFRRSGNLWLQTTATDDWTLEEQNEHGHQSVEESARE